MLKVEIQNFVDLEAHEKTCASDNGGGKEWANYLRMTHDGNTLFLENDAMEPEDASLLRDLAWVKIAIERAYEIGKAEGSREGT